MQVAGCHVRLEQSSGRQGAQLLKRTACLHQLPASNGNFVMEWIQVSLKKQPAG